MMASRLSLAPCLGSACLRLTSFWVSTLSPVGWEWPLAIPHLPPTKLQPQWEEADFPATLQTSPRAGRTVWLRSREHRRATHRCWQRRGAAVLITGEGRPHREERFAAWQKCGGGWAVSTPPRLSGWPPGRRLVHFRLLCIPSPGLMPGT